MTNCKEFIKEQKTRIYELEQEIDENKKKAKVEAIVIKYLLEIGMRANLKGYQYVKQAIIKKVLDPLSVKGTVELYKYIAKNNSIEWRRVERDIRYMIEKSWVQGNIEAQREMFGYILSAKTGKPMSSKFIAVMVERVKMEIL